MSVTHNVQLSHSSVTVIKTRSCYTGWFRRKDQYFGKSQHRSLWGKKVHM